MSKHHHNQNQGQTGEIIITILVVWGSFLFGKASQKNKHHNEIRKMKKTIKKLSSKINSNSKNDE